MFIRLIKSLLVLCLSIIGINSYSQVYKHADIWYFGNNAGLDFSSGQPIVLYDGMLSTGGTCRGSTAMCDTNSSLLFYSHGLSIWNKNHLMMDPIFMPSSYDVISFPKYGSDHEYYVFSVPNYWLTGPLDKTYYAIVDMNLNGGLGNVSQPVKLNAAWDPDEKITATRHKNKKDVWVIIRKLLDEQFAAFLVTEDSVCTQPVLSPAPEHIEPAGGNGAVELSGQIKVSYDKNYIINSYIGDWNMQDTTDRIEACKFNDVTGEITYLYTFKIRDISLSNRIFCTMGVEFSPDSKYLYLSGHLGGTDTGYVYQLDMQFIEDSASFIQSKVLVGLDKRYFGMQLARDGKIYITARHMGLNATPYLSIIHDPWKQGVDCNFEVEGVYLTPGEGVGKLTNIFPDFLYRFDYEGVCEGVPIQFDPWFVPDPVYIEWNFGDPASGANNTSTIPNATHVFTDGGTYEVSVHVEYPNGRIEETSRKIEIEYKPEPDLGADTSICLLNGEVELNAECGPYQYNWSTGASGTSQISVSDTGWYWVNVENEYGCFEIDSVYVSYFPAAEIDTSNMIISPTTCGGSTGAIKGIQVIANPPYFYFWADDMGDTLATTIDIYHLAVGNYSLHINDVFDCETIFGPYNIHDAGSVLIETVEFESDHCKQQAASITVNATSGLTDMLFYSVDNGNTYYANQGVFTGLSAGTYAVRVKDSTDCEDAYINNPVIIDNIPGPIIDNITVTQCSFGQDDGSINISASGMSDTLLYSNNNGTSYQINDGWFPALSPGFYTCIVMDEFGCDTTIVIEVTEEIIIHLQAIAGEDQACPGNTAFVALTVSNFTDVSTFKVNLLYDNNLLSCQGYSDASPQIEDSLHAVVYPLEGRVELNWSSQAVSLPAHSILAKLVFSSLNPGVSVIDWDGQTGESYFLNSVGDSMLVDYQMGNVNVYNEISVSLDPIAEACEGDNVIITPQLISSNGNVRYLWTFPNGDTSSQKIQSFSSIDLSNTGIYILEVIDTAQCQTDASIQIIVFENPVAAFAGQDTIITFEAIEIDAGSGFQAYLWNTGSSDEIITASSDGWYSVILESTDGCLGEDSVYVLFKEIIHDAIYIPNAFSPNGDGLNDEFKVIADPNIIDSFIIRIYNRWGNLVFEGENISEGWDGTYKGNPGPTGTYVYHIQYRMRNSAVSDNKSISGVLILTRQ